MAYPAAIANQTQAAASRYQLHVHGQNFASAADTRLGPVQVSLQGPGGTSTMRFTIERNCPANGGIAPFRGRAPVYFFDSLSDLKFRGYITHVTSRRSQGTKQVLDVDVVGLEKQLDERLVISLKTRADTGARVRKFTDDGPLVKAILKHGNLDSMIVGGFISTTTSGDLDDMTFTKQTIRECLTEIADVAQPESAYQLRRFYVDGSGSLHYYSGAEGLAAPFRIDEDGRYYRTIIASSGLVSFWSGRRTAANDIEDHKANATGLVSGGVTSVASLCIGHPELPAMRLNGINGYFGPSAANLHPGNTGSWFITFKRAVTGSAMTLISGGTNDIQIGFDSTDHLVVLKEGVGNMFVSTATYVNTAKSYHLVVTHSPANDTIVYINGDSVPGTATSRTLVAGSAAINVGRRKSGADQYFQGTVWGAGVSSSEFTATNAAVQFRAWSSVEPESLVVDRDSTDVTLKAWVTGANNVGSAWVFFNDAGDPNFEQVVTYGEGGPLQPEEFLDRPDAHTATKRKKYGHSYMAAKAGTVISATFTLTYDPQYVQVGSSSCWTPGQTVYITSNDAQGWSAKALEVKQVDIDLNNANGMTTYSITAGALPYSGLRKIRARSRGMA